MKSSPNLSTSYQKMVTMMRSCLKILSLDTKLIRRGRMKRTSSMTSKILKIYSRRISSSAILNWMKNVQSMMQATTRVTTSIMHMGMIASTKKVTMKTSGSTSSKMKMRLDITLSRLWRVTSTINF